MKNVGSRGGPIFESFKYIIMEYSSDKFDTISLEDTWRNIQWASRP